MRTLAITFLLFAVAGPASGDISGECVFPETARAKLLEACEMIRFELRVSAADWDRHLCFTEFARRYARRYIRQHAKSEAAQTVNNAEQNAANLFDTNTPEGFVRTFCGDAVMQAEFGEECDDGNDSDLDACDTNCELVP